MAKITEKVPVIFVSNFPGIISNKQTLTFDIMYTLASPVYVKGGGPQDPTGQDPIKFRVWKDGENTDPFVSNLKLPSMYQLSDPKDPDSELVWKPIKIEIQGADYKVLNPDWTEGATDKEQYISSTSDLTVQINFYSDDLAVREENLWTYITLKPKTYKAPQDGFIVGPKLHDFLLSDERAFLHRFKMNKNKDVLNFQDNFKDTIVTTQPTSGDTIYQTVAYASVKRSNVFTLDAAKASIRINREEGDVAFKIVNKSGTAKTVQVDGADYAMPAADRTTTTLFNVEASFWAVRLLFLEPEFLKATVGETAIFRLANEPEPYARLEYNVIPEQFGVVNGYNRSYKALHPGVGTIECIAYDKYDMPYETAKLTVFVEESKGENPIKIMMHNRETNRLTTIKGNPRNLKDTVYQLSKFSGQAITRDYFNKENSVVAKPVILAPLHNTKDYTGKVISSKFASQMEHRRKHVATLWEFARDQGFTQVLDKRQKIIGNFVKAVDLYDCMPPIVNVDVWVRVQYVDSQGVYSEWSDPVLFSAKDLHADVGGEAWTQGEGRDPWNGCYFKAIPYNEMAAYNYRGEFDTLKAHNLLIFKPGMQVKHKGKLWNCKNQMGTQTWKEPGTDDNYWEEDNRNNLPTPKNLVERYGISVGIYDNNYDATTYGAKKIGSTADDTNLKGWMFPDADYKWLKFGYKGKILYVLNKPVCDNISHTDVAKREAHDGQRTIRIGKYLYRLRMLTEDEYNVLFNEVIKTWPDADLGITKNSTQSELLMDEAEIYLSKNMKNRTELGYGERGGRYHSWRPVLEWIRPETEPYIYLPWSPVAKLENLQYDPITDTGYFGEVASGGFITFAQFRTLTGFTDGKDDGISTRDTWFKFYWHGKVMYVATAGTICSLDPSWLQSNGWSYFVDYMWAGGASRRADYKNLSFRVGQVTGCKWAALPHGQPFGNDEDLGQYSMWNELIYRVVGRFNIGNHEISGWENTQGGYQIGNNWAEYPLGDFLQGSNSIFIYCPETDAFTKDGDRFFLLRGGNSKAEVSLLRTWTLADVDQNSTDDGYLPTLQSPPQHFYIDQSYFDQFQILYSGSVDSTLTIYLDVLKQAPKEVIDQGLADYRALRKKVQGWQDGQFTNDASEVVRSISWREIWSDTPCVRMFYAPEPTNTGKAEGPYKWRESRLYMKPDYRLQGWKPSEWEQVGWEYCAHDTKPDIIDYDELSEPYGDRMYRYIKADLTNRGEYEDGSHVNYWVERKSENYRDIIRYTNIYNIISESIYGSDSKLHPID